MSLVTALIDSAEQKISVGDLQSGLDLFLEARHQAFTSGDNIAYVQCCQSAAVIFDRLKRYQEAVASLDLGIEASSLDLIVNSGLMVNKGVCLMKMRSWGQAIEVFKSVSSKIRRIPPKVRVHQMHELVDMAENNIWLIEDILKAEAQGQVITINEE